MRWSDVSLKGEDSMRKLTETDVVFKLRAEFDDLPVRGNAIGRGRGSCAT